MEFGNRSTLRRVKERKKTMIIERVRVAKNVSHTSVLITSRFSSKSAPFNLSINTSNAAIQKCETDITFVRRRTRTTPLPLVPRRYVRERERERDGHVLEGGPATTRVFLLPRGDARQKCNRWCGATRCNYRGNSRHAGFDADHPDARRRYAVPLHENNPSVPSVEGGAAEIPAGYEAPSSSPASKKRLSPRNVVYVSPPPCRWINRWNDHLWTTHTCACTGVSKRPLNETDAINGRK